MVECNSVTISQLLAWLMPVHLSFPGSGPLKIPLVMHQHMLALPDVGSLLKKNLHENRIDIIINTTSISQFNNALTRKIIL